VARAGHDGRDLPRIVEHEGIGNARIDVEVAAARDATETDADREIAPDFIAAAEFEIKSAADVLRERMRRVLKCPASFRR
jgi:hypothetical protein